MWSRVFGGDSEPVCANWSVKSGSLLKLLFFFGRPIQQGELESPGWSLSWMGLDGGRRIIMMIRNVKGERIGDNFSFWSKLYQSCGDNSRSCSVQYRITLSLAENRGRMMRMREIDGRRSISWEPRYTVQSILPVTGPFSRLLTSSPPPPPHHAQHDFYTVHLELPLPLTLAWRLTIFHQFSRLSENMVYSHWLNWPGRTRDGACPATRTHIRELPEPQSVPKGRVEFGAAKRTRPVSSIETIFFLIQTPLQQPIYDVHSGTKDG